MNKLELPVFPGSDSVFSQELIEVIRRYYILLIGVPVIVGLAAFVGSSYLPKKYASVTYLRMDRATSLSFMAMATSPAVADKVLADYPDAGSSSESRIRYLAGHISMTDTEPLADRGVARTFVFEVVANEARQAQNINAVLIDASLPTTAYAQVERSYLEAELKRFKIAADADTVIMDRLEKVTAEEALMPAASLMSDLISKRDRYLAEINSLERKLAGLSRDIVIAAPNLPQEPISVKNGVAILAALLSVPITMALLVVGRLLLAGRPGRQPLV